MAVTLLGVIPVLLLCAMWFVPPIAQNPEYHHFAGPRIWNVVSNAAFLSVPFVAKKARWVSIGAVLVAFGSAYYHWAPSDARLVWDRLPMTIVFMSVFAIAVEERLHIRALYPLLAIGIASVVYWRITGDLRPYAIVQFYPMLAILVLRPRGMTGMIVLYSIAKLLEYFDPQIATIIPTGGHPWKHVFSAAALIWFNAAGPVETQAGRQTAC
jgi:hypothetical protein